MSRRSNGEGTIVQRADGRWYGAISLGWKDGRRERKGVYGRTKRDVAKKMRKYLVDRDSGRPVSTSGQTLGKFLTSWLESIKHSVAVRTWDNYEAICRLHLIPALGKIRLERLTVEDIKALLNSKYEGGLSVTTVRHIKIALSIALNQGIGAGLLGWNAASRAKAPKKSHNQKVKAYSLDEVARIRAAAVQSRLDDILEVEFGLGLRRGEVLALSWNDIDLDSSPNGSSRAPFLAARPRQTPNHGHQDRRQRAHHHRLTRNGPQSAAQTARAPGRAEAQGGRRLDRHRPRLYDQHR
jgi:integrase